MSKLFLKALILLSILFGIISIITSSLAGWNLSRNLTNEYKSKGMAISRAIADASVEVVLNSNASTLQSMMDQFLIIEGVAYVFVTDRTNEILSHTFVPEIPKEIHTLLKSGQAVQENDITNTDLVIERMGKIMNLSAPILAGEAGYVHVGMDMALIQKQIWQSILMQQGLLLVVLLLTFFIAYRLISTISKPLNALTEYANKLAVHDFSQPLKDKQQVDRLAARTKDEISKLAEAFGAMEEKIIAYIQNLKETTAIKERIESELKIGRDIQMNIIPQTFPPFPHRPEFDVHAYIEPAKEIGGDFYDFFVNEAQNKFTFLIGDVSGKGVPAALFMAVTMTMFRATSSQSSDPAEVITIVNKALCKNNENALFVTLFYGVLDYKSGQLDYCLAGHNPPYLLKPGQAPVPLEGTQSMALGVDDSVQFNSKTITISKSAQLFAFTDGVTEAMNRKDDLYTDQRLATCLSSMQDTDPEPLISAVLDDVLSFADGADQADDITMLSVKLKGPQPGST